jgi:hypothetical protein
LNYYDNNFSLLQVYQQFAGEDAYQVSFRQSSLLIDFAVA